MHAVSSPISPRTRRAIIVQYALLSDDPERVADWSLQSDVVPDHVFRPDEKQVSVPAVFSTKAHFGVKAKPLAQ